MAEISAGQGPSRPIGSGTPLGSNIATPSDAVTLPELRKHPPATYLGRRQAVRAVAEARVYRAARAVLAARQQVGGDPQREARVGVPRYTDRALMLSPASMQHRGVRVPQDGIPFCRLSIDAGPPDGRLQTLALNDDRLMGSLGRGSPSGVAHG